MTSIIEGRRSPSGLSCSPAQLTQEIDDSTVVSMLLYRLFPNLQSSNPQLQSLRRLAPMMSLFMMLQGDLANGTSTPDNPYLRLTLTPQKSVQWKENMDPVKYEKNIGTQKLKA